MRALVRRITEWVLADDLHGLRLQVRYLRHERDRFIKEGR